MSISNVSSDQRDPAVKHAPSAYFKLVHAEEAEILSWAFRSVVSDISELGTLDSLAMRHNLRERKNILLMLLNRLRDG